MVRELWFEHLIIVWEKRQVSIKTKTSINFLIIHWVSEHLNNVVNTRSIIVVNKILDLSEKVLVINVNQVILLAIHMDSVITNYTNLDWRQVELRLGNIIIESYVLKKVTIINFW